MKLAGKAMFVALGVFAGLTTTGSAAASDQADYLDLLSRCRIAIETVAPFDAAALDNLGLRTEHVAPFELEIEGLKILSGDITTQKWGEKSSRFIVEETEYPVSEGKVRRSCHVTLSETGAPISPEEEVTFAEAFRNEQVFDAFHYVERVTAYPEGLNFRFSTFLELESTGENANGCFVEGALAIDNSLVAFFSSGFMEKEGDCDGIPLLLHANEAAAQ